MAKKPGRRQQSADVIEFGGNRSKLSKKEIEERRRNEARARPIAPKMPEDLSPDERECWELHAPELIHMNLLTVADVGAFRLLCEAYGIARQARRDMRPRRSDGQLDGRKRGVQTVIADMAHQGTLRRHPAFIIWKQAAAEYRALANEFGLTPSARVGLRPGAPPPSTVTDDEDDDAFFGT